MSRPLLFLHIPKTGGATVNSLLVRFYPEPVRIGLQDSITALERIKGMEQDQLTTLRCVHGHFAFGLHRMFSQPVCYATLFRHPVDRVVSEYRYYCRRNPEFLEQAGSLEEWVQGSWSEFSHNASTRMLAGRHGILSREDLSGLELAKQNLAKFELVGLTDRFDESILLFSRFLAWEWPVYEIYNQALTRPRIEDATRQLIEEKNQFDLELYALAQKRFEELLQEFPAPPWHSWLFRILNTIHSWPVARRILLKLLGLFRGKRPSIV